MCHLSCSWWGPHFCWLHGKRAVLHCCSLGPAAQRYLRWPPCKEILQLPTPAATTPDGGYGGSIPKPLVPSHARVLPRSHRCPVARRGAPLFNFQRVWWVPAPVKSLLQGTLCACHAQLAHASAAVHQRGMLLPLSPHLSQTCTLVIPHCHRCSHEEGDGRHQLGGYACRANQGLVRASGRGFAGQEGLDVL